MILVYAITLGTSAGITGLFARQVLAEQGYVPGFAPGVMVAVGVAAIYAGLQLLYVGLLRFVWPTKTDGPLLGECVSHCAILVLLPYLAHFHVDLHNKTLDSLQGFVYLGVFLAVHGALKFVGFYSILRSPPGPRAWNVVWVALAVPVLLVGAMLFKVWAGSVEKARPRAPENVQVFRVGTMYATARALPEGSVLTVPANGSIGDNLMIACANPPDDTGGNTLDMAYLTIKMSGETTTSYTATVSLTDDEWSFFEVPAESLPRKMESCQVRWSAEKESKWRSLIGILPVLTSDRTLLVAGPDVREVHRDDTTPNIVMLVVDGLGSDRVSSMGSTRAMTPNIDRLAASSLAFPFAYTPAPEAAAACMTLLTGVSPLRHGYLGNQHGPLPNGCKTIVEALRAKRYATAAFTEGEAWGDLRQSSEFQQGFDVFDDGYTPDTLMAVPQSGPDAGQSTEGSRETLTKASRWMDAHKDVQYMVFVRLGELRDTRFRERYGHALVSGPDSATPGAVYNAVIQRIDRGIGEFVAHARSSAPDKKTCIVITSTRGSYLPGSELLPDWQLRVPVVLFAPPVAAARRNELIALEDVPSTIARLAHVPLGPYASTADLVNAPISREPISMTGNPLVLSIRNVKMRLVWSTQRDPVTQQSTGPPAAAALYDLTRVKAGAPMRDISSDNPQTTKNWTDKLEQYYMMQREHDYAAAG